MWKLYQNEQNLMLKAHHDEQIVTKQKQKMEKDIPTLQTEQEEERKVLASKHAKELELIKKQEEIDTQQFEQMLEKKRAELELSFTIEGNTSE